MAEQDPLTYEQTGVSYADMDPFKIVAQMAGRSTARNLSRFGYQEIAESRGESAYVWDEGDKYGAMVTEGLGTKNLVADAVRPLSGRTHYDAVAQDTVAMIVNDLIVVGASPKVMTAHFSVGDSAWFKDKDRVKDLVWGWAAACNQAGAVWGGGETPTLKGVLEPGAIELSGTAVGEISPKSNLMLGEKIVPGDSIIFLGSTGIHANGLTLAREIASRLEDGYATRLADGSLYGEAILKPTRIYVKAAQQLMEHVDVHYMANITGHGWRKIMRAKQAVSYVIDQVPKPQPIFDFIEEQSGNDEQEMYGNFNMGVGFVVFVGRSDEKRALELLSDFPFASMRGGTVEDGPKQVVIEPKNLTFSEGSLKVR